MTSTPNPIPPQVIEKWREEFESNFDFPDFDKYKSSGHYKNTHRQAMWDGFLLARSTVEIHIRDNEQDNCQDSSVHHFNRGLMAAIDDIKAAGYRVAGEK
jgi:hypothetical protein